jgi:predicted AAA+ superfamily ATPase
MIQRLLMQNLTAALGQFPAVGLVGSRQSGKTTLAKVLAHTHPGQAVYLDLELPADLAKLAEAELYLEAHADRLVILDEIHRRPDLFPVLRALIDQKRRPGRFLLLGSASPALLRQGAETLAGRISFLELPPFSLPEVLLPDSDPAKMMKKLWVRGGYPDSFLAHSSSESYAWRQAFVSTFLERDLWQLGFRVSATRMRRFWEMLAHVHGQVWNASALARNFDVSAPTVRHHLDLLTDALLVRQLQPLHANLKKRLVKSPKIYLRDSGLLHALLRLADFEDLQGHPILGTSFEGFALEHLIQAAPAYSDLAFYRTHTGEEIDLVLTLQGGKRLAMEIKYTAAPTLPKYFRQAMADIGATRGYLVTAGREEFPLAADVRAVPLHVLLSRGIDTFIR